MVLHVVDEGVDMLHDMTDGILRCPPQLDGFCVPNLDQLLYVDARVLDGTTNGSGAGEAGGGEAGGEGDEGSCRFFPTTGEGLPGPSSSIMTSLLPSTWSNAFPKGECNGP